MADKIKLNFNSKFSSVEKLNENFLKAKCYVMALGKNRNKSHFSKESVDDAYSTLNYVPIIGHLMQNENGDYYLGGHDSKLVIENGSFKMKSVCVPFGVAIPSDTPEYEDVVEDDGTTATYLVSDVLIWAGRYPELTKAIYDESTYFGQSMEIIPMKTEQLKSDDKYTDITKFSFDALCMLNKSDDEKFHIEPCFPSSKIGAYSNENDFTIAFSELKEELKSCFEKNNKGEKSLEEKLKVLESFGKTAEELGFSIDDMTVEELQSKLTEVFSNEEPVSFSATYREKRKALCALFNASVTKDATGTIVEEVYFYVSDFDDEYVYVEKSTYNADGYSSMYGRQGYSFDDKALKAEITSDFEEMVRVWMTLDEKAKFDEEKSKYELKISELEAYQESHSHDNETVAELVKFKEDKIAEDLKNAQDEVLVKYADEIGNTDEFKTLVKDVKEFSVDALEKECVYIRGLYASPKQTDNAKGKSVKFSVGNEQDQELTGYDALYAKYLPKQ